MSNAGIGAGGSGSFSALTITDNDFNRLVKFVQSNYGIDLSQKKQLITGRLSTPLNSVRALRAPATRLARVCRVMLEK